MTTLSLNNLEEELLSKINFQAVAYSLSTEEESHHILKQAVNHPKLGDMALAFFGEDNGIELELPEKIPHKAPLL